MLGRLIERPRERGSLQLGIDMPFLTLVLLLLAFGAVMSLSASAVYAQQYYGDSGYFFKRYLVFAILSVACTAPFVLCAKPAFWRLAGVGLYAVSVFLLVLVLLIGTVGGGAQRWLVLGPITIQPSELAKTALILMLALSMSKHKKSILGTRAHAGAFRYGVLVPGGWIALIGVLVAAEKHISGLMIIGMLGVGMMLLGGTRLRYLLWMAGAVVAAGTVLILVSSYAQLRVDTWLHLEQVDPLGSAWQTLQGLYAIGSGGIFGVGLGNGRQKHGYVSQPQNDFIFTVICEELGFVGAALLLFLFFYISIAGSLMTTTASPSKICLASKKATLMTRSRTCARI